MGGEVALKPELSPDELAAYVFLDIAIILILARVVGALFRRIRQPAVIGEIVAGIALGPVLLGSIPLGADRVLGTTLFPPGARPSLGALANIGLILFMFIVGLELNLKLIKGNERLATGISLASVAFPFALGVPLAMVLFPSHQVEASFLAFALFIGAAMSVTAFPVLARILSERSMHLIPLGVVALAAAAVDDVLAWSLLAVVTAVAEGTGQWRLFIMLVESLAFVGVMLFVVRPLLRRLSNRFRSAGRLTPDVLAVVLVGLLLSSYVTSVIGIHAIFGAFMFGAVMPREDGAFLEAILRRIEQISVLLFLPVFFVTAGFNVRLEHLNRQALAELGLILLVACAGKFLGAAAAARLQGLPGRTSAAIGVLLNTRGLTELVILTVGLEKGVLDQELFTLLVIMAVVTTVMTEPLLRLIYPNRLIARDIAVAERAALAEPPAYRVLVAVDALNHAKPLADAAVPLVRGLEPAQIVLSHFRPTKADSPPLELGSGLATELAQIADTLEVLNSAAGSISGRDVEAGVLERASRNVAVDLPAQVATVQADAVLVDVSADTEEWRAAAAAIAAEGTHRLLVARLGEPAATTENTCVGVLTGTRSDDAVLDVAVRYALALSSPLLLLDGSDKRRGARRTESMADRLRDAGIVVRTERVKGSHTAVRVAVLAWSGDGPHETVRQTDAEQTVAELTILVHPGRDEVGELDQTLERLGPSATGTSFRV
jgi:Kef-type K+ transport system membrane component KefB